MVCESTSSWRANLEAEDASLESLRIKLAGAYGESKLRWTSAAYKNSVRLVDLVA
jgi:hypothetical protein